MVDFETVLQSVGNGPCSAQTPPMCCVPPFILGDTATLRAMLEAGGLKDAAVATGTGRARFSSIREWVQMDVRGRTLADMIDDAGFEALVAAAERELSAFLEAGRHGQFPGT